MTVITVCALFIVKNVYCEFEYHFARLLLPY